MRSLSQSHWPAETSEPVLETTVGSVLRDAAAAVPDGTAVIAWGLEPGTRRTWTFAELLRDAERTARALLSRFDPGEHVAIWAPSLPEWLLLEFCARVAGVGSLAVESREPPHD